MAISHVGSATANQNNGTTGFTVTIPTVQTGDLLYVFLISRDHTSGTAFPTVTDNDTGGNTWTGVANTTNRKISSWVKVATGSTSGKTVTVAGCVGSATGGLSAFRGVDTTAGAFGLGVTLSGAEENSSGDESVTEWTDIASPGGYVVIGLGNATNDTGFEVTSMSGSINGDMEPELWERASSGGSDCYAIFFGKQVNHSTQTNGAFTWAQNNSATQTIVTQLYPRLYSGTSAQTLADFTSSASGTVTPPAFTGTVAVTLAPFTAAATGTIPQPEVDQFRYVFDSTSDFTVPLNVGDGDLLLAFTRTAQAPIGNVGVVTPDGWTEPNFSQPIGTNIFKYVADGTETEVVFEPGATADVMVHLYVFRADVWYGDFDFVEAASVTDIDPPALNPSTWGTEDTYWLAVITLDDADDSPEVTGAPSGWETKFIEDSIPTTGSDRGAGLGSSYIQSEVNSINPGAFSVSGTTEGTNKWSATVGVRPVYIVEGDAAVTLDNFTSDAAGTVIIPITGTVDVTLADFTSSASGTYTPPPITGTAAPALDDFTSTASGTFIPLVTGTVDVTLANFTSDAAGTIGVNGDAAPTLANFTSTASGAVGVNGAADIDLEDFTSDATGTVVDGSGFADIILENFISNASGVFTPPVTGTLAETLDDFTSSASGSFIPLVTGSAAVTLDDFTAAGSGSFGTQPIVGTVAVTLEDFVSRAWEFDGVVEYDAELVNPWRAMNQDNWDMDVAPSGWKATTK